MKDGINHSLFLIACLAMSLTIAISNFLVQFQINQWLTWASLSYPLSFLVVDISNRTMGVNTASKVVMLGFILGVVLSFVSSTLRIAIASGCAFLIAQLVNLFIFNKLRATKVWWQAPLSSSSLSSLVDTFLFFGLAFAYTGVLWINLAAGDLIVKLLMALMLLPPYRIITRLITKEYLLSN